MALMIPKTIHYIWIGSPLPAEIARRRETWAKNHPGWEMKLWTEENLKSKYEDLARRCLSLPQRSDIYRYEILFREGGFYVDVDFECLKSFEPLLDEVTSFAVVEMDRKFSRPQISIGISGTVPGHPLYQKLIDAIPNRLKPEKVNSLGPALFSEFVHDHADVRIFPKPTFYPSTKEEMARAFAFHHPRSSNWSGDDAAFVSQRLPETMGIDEIGEVSVVMKNTGKFDWTEEEKVRLGALCPLDSFVWGFPRTLLPFGFTVKPGEDAEFKIKIKAPSIPGSYNFQRGLVREGVHWFGGRTPITKIKVKD